LVKVAAGALGGSGGGRDDVAQGGGSTYADTDHLAAAVAMALAEVEQAIGVAADAR
jgi:alanyl-tRNA synthetase